MLAERTTLACALVALFAAAPPEEDPPAPERPSGDHVAQNGDVLEGWASVESFHVPYGSTVQVTNDLSIHATQWILIEGRIEVVDRALEDSARDAPDVHLSSGGEVIVTGSILGGRGRSFTEVAPEQSAGQPGGDGSDLHLEAPRYFIEGVVHAGAGGQGGSSTVGGNGGSLTVVGDLIGPDDSVALARFDRTPVTGVRNVESGKGGKGGPGHTAGGLGWGGDGGDGGAIRFQPWPDSRR